MSRLASPKSPSNSKTLRSLATNALASVIASHVLPTPPLPEATAMILWPLPRLAKDGASGLFAMVVQSFALYLPNGLDFGLGVNFILAHHHRRGTEPFDDRTHIGTDAWTGQQHRNLTHHGLAFICIAQLGDELLKLRWRHG